MNGLSSTFNSTLSTIYNIDANLVDTGVRYGIMGFFLLGLVISLFMLLGMVLMFFFDKPCCKHCVYLSCCGYLLVFILYFLISLLFGLLTPTSYIICDTFTTLLGN